MSRLSNVLRSCALALTTLVVATIAIPAGAVITPSNASQLAAAMSSTPGFVTGGSFAIVPPGGTPNAVSDANPPLVGFPRSGSTFAILSSGNATLAGQPNTAPDSGADDGGTATRGGAIDTTVLKVDVNVPSGANCLSVDFRFLSEEFPEYVGNNFNDAFVAELDSTTWTIGAGGAISAPANFAFDPSGQAVTINTTGAASMNALEAAGTTYDGATPLLRATTPITPGSHSVYFSIFDQGDQIYDSAVFLDDIGAGFTSSCTAGATLALKNVQLTSTTSSSPPGVDDASLGTLPADKIPQSTPPDATAPIGRAPIGRAPIGRAPIGRAPIGRAPIGRAPIGRAPIGRAPIGRAPIGRAPLASIPVNLPGGWASILEHTRDLEATPAQSVTLFQLFNDFYATDGNASTLSELDARCAKVGNATTPPLVGTQQCQTFALALADLNLAGSPLENVSLLSFLLGTLTWSDIAPPASGWCAQWTQISTIPCDTTRTIFDSEAEGVPLDLTSLPLRQVGDVTGDSARTKAAFWDLTLADLNVRGTVLAGIPLSATSNPAAICAATCPALTTTLGQLAANSALSLGGTLRDVGSGLNGATLSDIVLMVMDPSTLDWEELPLADARFERFPAGNPTNIVNYELSFEIGCANRAGLHATATLPTGFAYRPGSSTLTVGGVGQAAVEPTNPSASPLDWSLASIPCVGGSTLVKIGFSAMPGFNLGTFGASASVLTTSIPSYSVVEQAPISVFDPGTNEGNETAQANHLYLGYLGENEIDRYDVTVPAGRTLSVTLSHLSRDYDLVLYAPEGAQTQTLLRSPSSVVNVSGGALLTDPADATSTALSPPALEGMHIDADRAVAAISSLRGTEEEGVSTTVVAGTGGDTTYTIQVTGHNGASGPEPYVLTVRDAAPFASLGTCPALPTTSTSARALPAGLSVPAIGSGDATLYLLDYNGLYDTYGQTAADQIVTAARTLASTPEGKGVLMPVDANAGADAALDAYRSNPCSVKTANAAVRAVNDAIDGLTGISNVKNIVIVGDDAIFPHAALPDGTVDGNESGFLGDTILADANGTGRPNHLSAVLASGSFLSDAPYATPRPIEILGGQIVYVPQWTFGRLAGSAADITGAITRFDTSNGRADPTTAVSPRRALVGDYDFMTDGGQQIFDELASQVGSTNAVHRVRTWDRSVVLSDFLNANGNGTPQLVSLNAHYDQYRMLPGLAPDGASDPSQLVTTADVTNATGNLAYRILFTIGCHFALGIPNAYAPTSGDPRALDWAEAYSRAGIAAMVGNLGYGYGDTATVGFSERLMVDFASRLDGSATIGAGLVAAQQQYLASASALSPYDFKVLEQTVLWGLPMYLPTAPISPPSPPATPPAPTANAATSNVPATTVTVNPTFNHHAVAGGTEYFDANGLSEAIHPYPIMPKTVSALPSAANLVAHGAVPISLTRTNEQTVNIAFSNATIDASSIEPARAFETVYPLTSRIASAVTAAGSQTQNLVVIPAEFESDDDLSNSPALGTFAEYAGNWLVTYGGTNAPTTPPEITNVTVSTGGAISARVTANGPFPSGMSPVARVFAWVLRTDDALTKVELTGPAGGGVFTGTSTGASAIRAVTIYAVDGNGNTAAAHDKRLGFAATAASGDRTKPTITIWTPTPAAVYDVNQVVAENRTCIDDTDPTPSLTDSNPGTNLDTKTTGLHKFTVTCTDASGNTTKATESYFVLYRRFDGFFAPTDRLPTVNIAKAGQTIPLKWKVVDASGVPVSDPRHFVSVTTTTFGNCTGTSDAIETYSGNSGLQYLGGGNWQFNWKTPKTWSGSCREVSLNLNDGTATGRSYVAARFSFR